ncbi:MAG TPA: bifunctional ADP-heptose synthase [Catalimonadaceae bacterium]|nr:bifunctional ADP-heptose synthase [Catalimonadaceae bacterium]HPI10903.1 bifunctional ADP-heptose synthase [Catalimonadaceae bacterium]
MQMENLFDKMNHLKVLVIGDVMADAYIRGKVERISPEAPVPVLNSRHYEIRLGGAANVALNLKALGAKVYLCSLVGQDSKGEELIKLIDAEDIGSEGIVRSQSRPTTIKTRIIAAGQHLLRIDEEDDRPAFPDEKSSLLKKALALTALVDAVVFEDYDKGVIFPELIQEVTALALKRGIPVTVDPKKRNFTDYKGVTLFKPNLKELREGLKIELNPKNSAELEAACKRTVSDLGVQGVLLTLSENGMAIYADGTYHHTPAMQRDIADVSGAGDTVISVATACMAVGFDLKSTLILANMAGGLVCEYSGVVPIQKDILVKEALLVLGEQSQ